MKSFIKFHTGLSVLVLMLLLSLKGVAQVPEYTCDLRNDVQISPKCFEFDIYLKSTGTTEFEFTNMQTSIILNPAVINGGNISVSLVPGSSELNASQVPFPAKFSFTHAKSCINITAMQGPGAGDGTMISQDGMGTRFGRIRITNTVDFAQDSPNLQWGWNLDLVSVITKVAAYIDMVPTEITVAENHTTSQLNNYVFNSNPLTVNLSGIMLQGLYAESGLMLQASDEAGAHWPEGIADKITVELHGTNFDNYEEIAYSAVDIDLTTTGEASFQLPSNFSGSYYVTIKHRNSIETVSANPVVFGEAITDISFALPENVYGMNLRSMEDGGYAIFAGEQNADRLLDGSDLMQVYLQAAAASSGYVSEDVNGDGLVDGTDLYILVNNVTQAVSASIPGNFRKPQPRVINN